MADLVLLLVAAVGFAVISRYLKRNPDWSRGEDGTPYSAPGWWKPPAAAWLAVLVLFVVVASVEHGFRWPLLLVFPILGGAFALVILALRTAGRRVRQD